MLDSVREGASAVLVIRGEAGIGKTALMQYCARQASGCRVAQIAGVESELEMPLAAVHQLCAPMLDHLGALPEPQQQALRVALGAEAGNAPDRFVVGLAVLGLLTEVAAARPLVCLVDDAQWLDEPSRQIFGFVGRRLLAEPVLLLLAVRETGEEQLFPALSSLTLEGLAEEDARALVTAAVPGHLDERVRERIVDETAGNPLRLLELPRAMSPAELAGGFGAHHTDSSFGPLEEHYARRIRALPSRRSNCCCSRQPTPPVMPRSSGGLRRPSASREVRQPQPSRNSCSRSGLTCASAIRWFGLPPTLPGGPRTAALCTWRSLPRPTPTSIQSVASGTWRLRPRARTKLSPPTRRDGGHGSSTRRVGGRRRIPPAFGRLDRRPGPPGRAGPRRGPRSYACRGVDAARGLLAEVRGALATDDVQRGRIERLRGSAAVRVQPRIADGPVAPSEYRQGTGATRCPAGPGRHTSTLGWRRSSRGLTPAPGGLLPEVSRAA